MRGAWIEILHDRNCFLTLTCRSPCGERGLKSLRYEIMDMRNASLPMRGAWIEIVSNHVVLSSDRSLPMRGAWIEIFPLVQP